MSVCRLQVWHPLGFSRVWGGNTVAVERWCTHQHPPLFPFTLLCLFEVTVKPPAVLLAITQKKHWYQHNDHWPQIKKTPCKTNLNPHTCHPQSQPALALPIRPSLVNSTIHHPVVLAAICTLFALKVSCSSRQPSSLWPWQQPDQYCVELSMITLLPLLRIERQHWDQRRMDTVWYYETCVRTPNTQCKSERHEVQVKVWSCIIKHAQRLNQR